MTTQTGAPGKTLTVPRRSLVLLVGPSGAGKSTFAQSHFSPLQVIESDHCRALVCDDPSNQSATRAAFDLLHFIADRRLEFDKLTVIDATNIEAHARRSLLALARDHNFTPVAIVFDVGEEAALRQNSLRDSRQVAAAVIRQQYESLNSSRKALSRRFQPRLRHEKPRGSRGGKGRHRLVARLMVRRPPNAVNLRKAGCP